MIVRAADAVLGPATVAPGERRRWPGYLVVATLLAAILIARKRDTVTNAQFWAEDGYVFFYENLTLGLRALVKGYNGCPQLGQRLVAFAASPFPLARLPLVYNLAAALITASAMATFWLPCFRHLIRSDGLRLAFSVATVCMPAGGEPMIDNVVNLGWFLAIWVLLVSVMPMPRRLPSLVLLSVATIVAMFSNPLPVVTLPAWLLRLTRAVKRCDRTETAYAGVMLLAIAVLLGVIRYLQGKPGATEPEWPFSLVGVWHVIRYRLAALVLPPTLLRRLVSLGGAWPGIAAIALLVLLLALARVGRFATVPGLVVGLGYALAAIVVTQAGRPVLSFLAGNPDAVPMIPARYAAVPTAMLVLALFAVVDGLPPGARRVAGAVVLASLVAARASELLVAPFPDLQWPQHAAALEAKLRTGTRDPLVIPMNPRYSAEAQLRFDVRGR